MICPTFFVSSRSCACEDGTSTAQPQRGTLLAIVEVMSLIVWLTSLADDLARCPLI